MYNLERWAGKVTADDFVRLRRVAGGVGGLQNLSTHWTHLVEVVDLRGSKFLGCESGLVVELWRASFLPRRNAETGI